MKAITFFITAFMAFAAAGQSVTSGDSSIQRRAERPCMIIVGPRWPLLPALSTDVTIHNIDPVKLCNGSFSVIMDYKQTVALIRTNFVSLSCERKEKELKYLDRINENMSKGYGYHHPDGIHTFNLQQLIALPQRNINSIAGVVPGVDSRNGQTPHIKGARPEGTAYFIDGVRANELNATDPLALVLLK